jgi:hypothetical protein
MSGRTYGIAVFYGTRPRRISNELSGRLLAPEKRRECKMSQPSRRNLIAFHGRSSNG